MTVEEAATAPLYQKTNCSIDLAPVIAQAAG